MQSEKEHHHHKHSHSHHHTGSEKNIRMAFVLNLSFALIEAIGGVWTNSIAILTDALHDFGDALSLGTAWFLQRKSEKGADDRFSYGYARFSLLGALISAIVLVTGSGLILFRTIPRLFHPQSVQPQGMLVFALLGIAVNGVAMLRLSKGTSLNEKVVSWHLLEDILGWVVVLLASIVLMFWDIPIIDPILSLGITVYVLINVFKNLKEVFTVFLQGVPDTVSVKGFEEEVAKALGNTNVHHIHVWSLDGEKTMMSMHMTVPDETSPTEVIKAKREINRIAEDFGVQHLTIQTDYLSEQCNDRKDE